MCIIWIIEMRMRVLHLKRQITHIRERIIQQPYAIAKATSKVFLLNWMCAYETYFVFTPNIYSKRRSIIIYLVVWISYICFVYERKVKRISVTQWSNIWCNCCVEHKISFSYYELFWRENCEETFLCINNGKCFLRLFKPIKIWIFTNMRI